MFYATQDSDGDRITESAEIAAFETQEQARAWLLSPYSPDEWNIETAKIDEGRFGDCWIKTHSKPEIENSRLIAGFFNCSPFTEDQLNVAGPGQHPGGNVYWITPSVPVLVVTHIAEKDSA